MKRFPGFSSLFPVVFLLTTLIAGCAKVPPAYDPDAIAEYQQVNDPVEFTNRIVFHVNRELDIVLLNPAAHGYRTLPRFVRNSARNFLINWNEPLVFIHDLLQGELGRAGETVARFVTNTVLGCLGVGDIASAGLDIHHHEEDMGQTLAVWGIGEGPYVMLPLLGPSNARDAVGRVADFFLDPVSLVVTIPTAASAGKVSLEGIDRRERYLDVLNDLERISLDYYVSLRTLYRQRRAEEINNGHKTVGSELVGYNRKGIKALSQDLSCAFEYPCVPRNEEQEK